MDISNLKITELEERGLLVYISSPWFDGFALMAPDGYEPKEEDPPVFYHKELAGIAKHGIPEMIGGLYEAKKVWSKARATGIIKETCPLPEG